MGQNKRLARKGAKKPEATKNEAVKIEGNIDPKVARVEKQMESSLTPLLTEISPDRGGRTSRFGRPQKETHHPHSVPTELTKFISKSSPKRFKPKQPGEEKSHVELRATEDEETPTQHIKEESSAAVLQEVKIESETECSAPAEVIIESQTEPTSGLVEDANAEDETVEGSADRSHSEGGSDASFQDKRKSDFSDTDSALGSAASIKGEPKEEFELVPGQIIWGGFNGRTWYPCMIYPNTDGDFLTQVATKSFVFVKYFNYDGKIASLPIKNVFAFASGNMDAYFDELAARKIKKSRMKNFNNTCIMAIEEAKLIEALPMDERMAALDNIVQRQRELKSNGKSSHRNSLNETGTSSRMSERKSIDSAIGTSMSPAPSSPSREGLKVKDPIEHYMFTFAGNLDKPANLDKTVKRERKTAKVIKKETVEVDPNVRKSNRTVKKRKFIDIEDEPKQEASQSPSVEPKPKRPKIPKEETLEERFLIGELELKTVTYRPNHRKRACHECFTINKQPTFKCTGKDEIKCAAWFHEQCSGHSETRYDEVRHQTGDSDDFVRTEALKMFLTCKSCYEDIKKCFVCKKQVAAEDDQQNCPNQDCYSSYHSECLNDWPQNNKIGGSSKRSELCPQHLCHTCYSNDVNKQGALVKCIKCPSAYHSLLSCMPAGSIPLSQTQMICPRHPTDAETLRNSKEKPLNMDFCQICCYTGNIVCCETCPTSFHPQCIDYVVKEDVAYKCQECKDGRLPLYNTIVWARVGHYRWWPSLIMPNNVVPESVLKIQKYDREFCVRFFGSYDYIFTTCERVILYDGTNVSAKGGHSKLDFAFNAALVEAKQMQRILASGTEPLMNEKPKPYARIQSNRPVLPVKLKKYDKGHQSQCSCKSKDPNPCGYDSSCINYDLLIECDSRCPAGDACLNQKLRNRANAEMKIMKTQTRGFGAVSIKDIPEQTFVIEYVGELIDSNELKIRMDKKTANKEKDFYFMTIGADLIVDAELAGNLSRFINHSCDPNCYTRKVTVDGNTRIGLFTNQLIKAGTELTFDYQMAFVGDKMLCKCGATNCSGLIGEKVKEEAPTRVQVKSSKRKAANLKIALPASKKKRIKEERPSTDTQEPFVCLLQTMGKKPRTTANSRKAYEAAKNENMITTDTEVRQEVCKMDEEEPAVAVDEGACEAQNEPSAAAAVDEKTCDVEGGSSATEVNEEGAGKIHDDEEAGSVDEGACDTQNEPSAGEINVEGAGEIYKEEEVAADDKVACDVEEGEPSTAEINEERTGEIEDGTVTTVAQPEEEAPSF